VQIIWRFLGQRPRLESLGGRPLSPGAADGPRPGDNQDRYERVMAREAPGPPEPDGPYRRLAAAVGAYRVFPPRLLAGVLRRVPVGVGDTLGTCYHFLPGVDLFFGGRVTQCFDGQSGDIWRTGWTFQTLAGHPEVGEETFWVEKDAASGEVRAGLRSWSRPGLWLTRAVLPWARRQQVRAGRAALDHLAAVAAGAAAHSAST
jgi:hypothetical protein